MFFSFIIPVYNRSEEVNELLSSLLLLDNHDFEVIIIEDGSSNDCIEVVQSFEQKLAIQYITQDNQGQGFARNNGMRKAVGDFFVILDSDVILPPMYLTHLSKTIKERDLDAFGGPDAASDDFSAIQKAMDFAMTSLFTTGGIRGKLKDPSKFQARGFNMGVSRKVFDATGGFKDSSRAEDIEWSIRIKKAGFRLELVSEAFVFHKRKNSLITFMKQSFSFGRNRINVSRYHARAIQLVHLMPLLFLIFCMSMFPVYFLLWKLFFIQLLILGIWSGLVLLSAIRSSKSIKIGFLSLLASFCQLFGYGLGLAWEFLIKIRKG